MKRGDMVVIESGDWAFMGKRGVVLDPRPSSTQCGVLVSIDGGVGVVIPRDCMEVLRWSDFS